MGKASGTCQQGALLPHGMQRVEGVGHLAARRLAITWQDARSCRWGLLAVADLHASIRSTGHQQPSLARAQASGSRLEMRMDAQWVYKADESGALAALGGLRCHMLIIPSEPDDASAQVNRHVQGQLMHWVPQLSHIGGSESRGCLPAPRRCAWGCVAFMHKTTGLDRSMQSTHLICYIASL